MSEVCLENKRENGNTSFTLTKSYQQMSGDDQRVEIGVWESDSCLCSFHCMPSCHSFIHSFNRSLFSAFHVPRTVLSPWDIEQSGQHHALMKLSSWQCRQSTDKCMSGGISPLKKQKVGQGIQNGGWEVFQEPLFEWNFRQRHRCRVDEKGVCSMEILSRMERIQLKPVRKIHGVAFYRSVTRLCSRDF